MKTNVNDVKMDKKEFKKLSKGKAYDEVYNPLFDVAADASVKLEKAGELLDQAAVDVQEAKKDAEASKKDAEASKKFAAKATARAESAEKFAAKATARAESAENKVDEARELQDECKLVLKFVDDEINFKTTQSQSARNKVSEADEEFTRALGENLTLSAQNTAIKKATVNTTDEEFAKAFEGFKNSRIAENERQMALNKESAFNMRERSTDFRMEAEGYERRIIFLKEQRNKALIAYAEACLNMNLGE